MKIDKKLEILADSAKYDASCASSGSTRKAGQGGLGAGAASGICHSWAADGRCISLLKILLSNDCRLDCAYCLNRRSNTLERATFTPEEVADVTVQFYLRNYIEGLFLSSAVYASPDRTMEDMIEVCRILRKRKHFRGYIHLKIIPGTSPENIMAAGLLADRLSVNIELPSEKSLRLLAPGKTGKAILQPMQNIAEVLAGFGRERKRSRTTPTFSPAGHSTQLIVGASEERDLDILHLVQHLYRRMALKRVYYSAYIGVNSAPMLPAPASAPPLLREHRLYQADWLLRFYRFEAHELLSPEAPDLDHFLDPKASWALRNFNLFPLDINRASYDELLRVPGIGVVSARRIVEMRRKTVIRREDLRKCGLVLKWAQYFISLNGRAIGPRWYRHRDVVRELKRGQAANARTLGLKSRQLRLF